MKTMIELPLTEGPKFLKSIMLATEPESDVAVIAVMNRSGEVYAEVELSFEQVKLLLKKLDIAS